ncbi:MAG: glutamate racemase [Bacteroidota bacterium]
MDSAIGVFDSGVGGTSVWKEIVKLLPNERTIYLADSKNAPYGGKAPKEIVALSIKNTELLLQKGCKLVVVACNTATTNAIDYLRKNYPVPFIGIEPAIKPAALHTKTKKVGILATKGTLSSSLFYNTSKLFAQGIEVIEQDGSGLVQLIEEGNVYTEATKYLLEKYLAPMLNAGIDSLVLGCTHYPYLIPVLRQILPESITILDSSEAVARQTKHILSEKGLLSLGSKATAKHDIYTNHTIEVLKYYVNVPGALVNLLDF